MRPTPILESSSEFSRATSKCLRSTGATCQRKGSVSCGTRILVVGLLEKKWLQAKGCQWDSSTSNSAAFGGHLEVLQWIRSEDPPCPWNSRVCRLLLVKVTWRSCAGRGASAVDEEVPYAAAQGGHLKVLKWLIKEGCPHDKHLCREYAAHGGTRKVLEWLDDTHEKSHRHRARHGQGTSPGGRSTSPGVEELREENEEENEELKLREERDNSARGDEQLRSWDKFLTYSFVTSSQSCNNNKRHALPRNSSIHHSVAVV